MNHRIGWVLVSCLMASIAYSQETEVKKFEIDGQILQRAESRHGHEEPIKVNQENAKFITQRARLQAQYKHENLTLYVAVQDVRTWGDSPQVKRDDANLSVHEAWANYSFSEQWSLKTGRQELNYDNFRFLGNLDWYMQGRAHDFALIKYEKGNKKLHFGGGYNQNGGNLPVTGSIYAVANQYKSAQMLRFEDKGEKWQYSFLAWNESRTSTNLSDAKYYDNLTLGLPTLRYTSGKNVISGFAYYQTGKDVVGKKLSGYDVSAQFTRTLWSAEESGKKLRMLVGFEMISGTDSDEAEKNHSFNPLYGTNHLYNGYMDVFYVGNKHINSVGLNDYYFKTRYDFNKKLFTQLDYHFFQTNAKFKSGTKEFSSDLGSEIDLSLGYIVSPAFSIQAGYSQLFYSDTFEALKGGNLRDTQNWAYIMLVFRPNMPQKFIGILF